MILYIFSDVRYVCEQTYWIDICIGTEVDREEMWKVGY